MKKLRIVSMLLLIVGAAMCVNIWTTAIEPTVSSDLAITAVNGTTTDWNVANMFTANKDTVRSMGFVIVVIAVLIGIYSLIRNKKMSATTAVILCCLLCMCTTGCIKPYDVPEYKNIEPSQTGFLIKLEGTEQVKLRSADYLQENRVATKRVQITHRWNKTGRFANSGQWIPTVRLIIVDRSPITVELDTNSGANKGKDTAVWMESADSVGFSMGFSKTAYIKEDDAATFLYMYPNSSLADVLMTEGRARIQQVAAEMAAKYKLDELRDKKAEIINAVRDDIIPFFALRGITITTVGMFGGMTYENPKIQESIDNTFIAQQEKVVAKAILDSQEDKNKKIKSEALALAEAAETQAKGIANGNLLKAQAEAAGIEAVNLAIAKANNNPMLIQLKQIEVQKIQSERWGGAYPSTLVGSDAKVWVSLGPATDKAAAITQQ